jgi:hypothetical protein
MILDEINQLFYLLFQCTITTYDGEYDFAEKSVTLKENQFVEKSKLHK